MAKRGIRSQAEDLTEAEPSRLKQVYTNFSHSSCFHCSALQLCLSVKFSDWSLWSSQINVSQRNTKCSGQCKTDWRITGSPDISVPHLRPAHIPAYTPAPPLILYSAHCFMCLQLYGSIQWKEFLIVLYHKLGHVPDAGIFTYSWQVTLNVSWFGLWSSTSVQTCLGLLHTQPLTRPHKLFQQMKDDPGIRTPPRLSLCYFLSAFITDAVKDELGQPWEASPTCCHWHSMEIVLYVLVLQTDDDLFNQWEVRLLTHQNIIQKCVYMPRGPRCCGM